MEMIRTVHAGQVLRTTTSTLEYLVTAGNTIILPAGTVHTVCNPDADHRAVARWTARPALRTGEFFEVLAAAGDDVDQRLAVLADHPEEFQLGWEQPSLKSRGDGR